MNFVDLNEGCDFQPNVTDKCRKLLLVELPPPTPKNTHEVYLRAS